MIPQFVTIESLLKGKQSFSISTENLLLLLKYSIFRADTTSHAIKGIDKNLMKMTGFKSS